MKKKGQVQNLFELFVAGVLLLVVLSVVVPSMESVFNGLINSVSELFIPLFIFIIFIEVIRRVI